MVAWKNTTLGEVAPFWTGKIKATKLNCNNFISTDNMLSNKGGVTKSRYVQTKGNSISFKLADILVSNIRPYFKKIWFADKNGGCSNDILVFRANINHIDPNFAYYLLSDDNFFDYMMSGANGTKMPRGNRKHILKYKIKLPPSLIQKKIAEILTCFDGSINKNLDTIKLLEESARIAYEETFLRFKIDNNKLKINQSTDLPFGWQKKPITSFNSFKQDFSKIKKFEGEKIYYETSDIEYTSILGNGEIINWNNKPSRAQIEPKNNTVWFARMSDTYKVLCFNEENKYLQEKSILSSGFAGFKATSEKCLPFLYLTISSEFFHEIKNLYATGATQVSLNNESMKFIKIVEPSLDLVENFGIRFLPLIKEITLLKKKNELLRESRDILLPRLITKIIDIEKLDIVI